MDRLHWQRWLPYAVWVLFIFAAMSMSLAMQARADEPDAQAKALATILGIALQSDTVPPAEIKDDWKKVYDLSASNLNAGAAVQNQEKVTVWVEQGWLNARETNAHGRIDWQVALAQPDGKTPIEVNTGLQFELKYGPYFIRDSFESVRILRQFKEADSPPWPVMKYEGEQRQAAESSSIVRLQPKPANLQTKQLIVGDWHWLQTGPPNDHPDIWIRIDHKDLVKGFGSKGGLPTVHTVGEHEIADEGDLFRATRDTVAMAEFKIDIRDARAKLKAKQVPELDCKDWRHTDNDVAVSMQALRGQVVLLDFWGGGYHTGNDEQDKLEALYQKYKDRNFMVVAVHTNGEGMKLADLLKLLAGHEFSFPVGLDAGESAKSYGVDGYPTLFLIDKHGMVKETLHDRIPSQGQIEQLLDAN